MKVLVKTADLSRADWLKWRTKGIGGSDASVIAGINPYKSVYQLWKEKTGQIERRDLLYMGHLCMRLGHGDDAMRCYYRLYAMTQRDVPAFTEIMTDAKTLSLFSLDSGEISSLVETVVMIPDIGQLTA